jgi:hypothetical protein
MAASPQRRHEQHHEPDAARGEWRDLVDDARADDGARARRDRFWQERVEQETMTLPGLLLAMAERAEPVRLVLRRGAPRLGRITAVGSDVVAMAETNGHEVLVAMHQIVTVRAAGSALIAVDSEPCAAILRDQLLALTEARAEVRLVLDSGPTEAGILEACGVGVVALRTPNREVVYIAEAGISEIVRVKP